MDCTINERDIRSADIGGLLTIILGNNETAYNVKNYISRIDRLPTIEQLQKIKGIGRTNAMKVMACMELSSRYFVGTNSQKYRFPEDVASRVSFLKYEEQEHFVAISLNADNRILNIHDISRGLVNRTQVHPREAFRKAITDNAVSIIFVHNHPSGSTEESPEDLGITRMLVAAGKILQIPVIDHIIVSKCGINSLLRKFPEMFDTK